ncbi:hypothetical protein [Glutamicibacter sp.]|uniref:hypothetical protein n=1 Tax=Glutamicibacter sp. TaxID=1931995 RepID=UPI0028BF48EB|nr:hypothetical protein [Glutamicibacter sp.]
MKSTKVLGFTSLAVASALALAGCSGSDNQSEDSTSPSPTVSSTATESSTAEASATDSTASATGSASESSTESAQADSGELKIYKASSPSYTDTVMDHEFEVTGVAMGFTGEGEFAEAPGDNTYVAVKYKASAGDKYFNGTSCSNTRLSSADSSTPTGDTNSLQKKAMEKAGIDPMEDVRQGESTEGWCLYYVPNPTLDNLTATYQRLPMKDGDKTYKEESKDLKITVEK